MKILPFKIPKPKDEALVYQEDREKVFYDQLHQHAEIQISYIEKGEGTLIVGDSINEYKANDILVIGSYVPHVFRSDTHTTNTSVMRTLFFDQGSFGKDFFDLPDLAATHPFFQQSVYGMKVVSHKENTIALFKQLRQQNKLEQIASLLLIINQIAKSETQPLSSFVYNKAFSDDEGKRLNKVFDHVMDHYHEQITLQEVSEIAHMSKNAFCRYFKKRTNKTFFQFLIEIRIENASKRIIGQPELPISLVSEQCGFSNLANFNRKFKELKGCTPTQYRAQFQ
ncbi:helix-turn-helix domain-containing protein [Flagellimonas olearia]|uniref:Helix-turn-helix domain-containing protein n=1 Tax=Flagellimonas olearia TaxID=552546 RepID=A0A6I1E6C5_9FLAO|nr:AraC family transcriptional regulator [Allomuricauda olearia]KAB7531525.1 helix-turn-helix domain-containing protein [Allomuricauda olearia]